MSGMSRSPGPRWRVESSVQWDSPWTRLLRGVTRVSQRQTFLMEEHEDIRQTGAQRCGSLSNPTSNRDDPGAHSGISLLDRGH